MSLSPQSLQRGREANRNRVQVLWKKRSWERTGVEGDRITEDFSKALPVKQRG